MIASLRQYGLFGAAFCRRSSALIALNDETATDDAVSLARRFDHIVAIRDQKQALLPIE
jgi:hypothetical protein